MRIFLLFYVLFSVFLFASEVQIESKKFEGDDKAGVSKFIGEVKVKKGADTIDAELLTVYFDSKRTPVKFEASGNAKFKIINSDGKTYAGHSDKIVYLPQNGEYTLIGNAFAELLEDGRKIYGEKIFISDKSKKAEVVGADSKPAKFIFKIEDKK